VSSARVSSFSLASRSLRAKIHSARVTIFGSPNFLVGIWLLLSFEFRNTVSAFLAPAWLLGGSCCLQLQRESDVPSEEHRAHTKGLPTICSPSGSPRSSKPHGTLPARRTRRTLSATNQSNGCQNCNAG